ncbi:MAG: histidine phosphatase family protein [Parvularculaceae bacterium]|jgi:phosphohistidine phosphatase SixA|nr:histidine phosphatase family protein [Parvularculaceae bacterium]
MIKMLGALVAVFLVAGAARAAETAPRTLEAVLADLARGGSVILMRHANAPEGQLASVGLTENCDFGDRRGLDAKGFFQARFIGEFFRESGVGIALAYTSDSCRAFDTARLIAAGGPVLVEPALKTTERSEIDSFKTVVTTAFAGGASSNVLLVTHSNIVPLYVDWGSTEEIPSGVILIVDPLTWTVKERLNLDIDLSVGSDRTRSAAGAGQQP